MRFWWCCLCLLGHFVVCGQLQADFTSTVTSGCSPLTVQFNDKSSGNPTQWYWDFGNGTNSYVQNPSAVYATRGTYTVRLIIKDATNQNYIEKKNYITVSATPNDTFSVNKPSGCVPLQVTFANGTNLFGETIKSWQWNFGDGNTSNEESPSYTYSTRGVFNVSLIAQTAQGCIDSFSINAAVKAGNNPGSVSFTASPLDGCASVLRNFKGQVTGAANNWNWSFGDGGRGTSQNISYHYTDTGYFSVKLVAADNGCADSVTRSSYIHVKGPVAEIGRRVDCANPYEVNFLSNSRSAASWSWYFGDGGTSLIREPIHKYSATGSYPVRLIVTGSACIDSTEYLMNIVSSNPSYKITPATNSFCKNDTLQFEPTNYDSSDILYMSWSFDNGVTRTSNEGHLKYTEPKKFVYPNAGTYPAPILYTIDKESCRDTIQVSPLIITGTLADFKSSSPACAGDVISFSDNSKPSANSPVKQWIWKYGDGDSAVAPSSPATHNYPFAGEYNISLKITDANGCTDTISHQVSITNSPVVDAGKDSLICAGKSITLQPGGGVSYTWNNSAYLSCTNCANPVATLPDAAVFYVTGSNAAGCTANDSVVINVQKQETVAVSPASDSVCVGESVQLLASGADVYTWQPAEGLNNSNAANPVATPDANTVYTVQGSDSAGCFVSSATVNITASPKPKIDIADTSVTIPAGSSFQINIPNSADVVKWQWQPSLGLSNPSIPNPVAQPQQTTKYSLIGENAAGCISVVYITINVLCINSILFIPNTFSPNNDGMNDYFYPRSAKAVHVKTFRIFNRWGQEVYEKSNFFTNDQSSGWNGKYKSKEQQADAYVYFLQIECANGGVFTKQGSISLIR